MCGLFTISFSRRLLLLGTAIVVTLLALNTNLVRSQDAPTAVPQVLVEAIQQANVRSGPGIDYDLITEITVGTKYLMIGRSAQFPWYLISLPQTSGWVYVDLVKVSGNIATIPYTELIITPGPSPFPTSTPEFDQSNASVPLPTPTLEILSSVTVEAQSISNVRYGPGTDFRPIGKITKGTRYPVMRRHTQFDWVEIAFDASPSGLGWVSLQTVDVFGSIFEVPAISTNDFGYPTLTPTAIMVVTAQSPWESTETAPVNDPKLEFLGNTVYDLLLKSRFDPGTDRQASVFIRDLATQQTVSLNPNIAYSGVSMMKIPVLLSYYRKYSSALTVEQGKHAAQMMVCSENPSSNTVLRYIGDGDDLKGAQYVTETLQTLGLKDTFLTRPFSIGKVPGTPTPTPLPADALQTHADQVSTEPDLYNQTTPADLGWLLSSLYQCAVNDTGPIATEFKGDVTMMECRQIINAMRYDKIGSLIEAGIPPGTNIAHKHGWGNDIHGDAALVMTPGGDYVLVVMMHQKEWLESDESFPLVAEISRLTYNAFNLNTPMADINLQTVPAECTAPDLLISDFTRSELPSIK
jgi:uncharacterized protein YgiM (DUF1202 family)/beta-lactamase class A